MARPDLHRIASRILAQSGLTKPDGRATSIPVDISALAEGLGLEIVGAKSRGRLRLTPWKVAELKPAEMRILVRSSLLDNFAREADLREVLAHEVAHFCAHLDFVGQLAFSLDLGTRPAKAGRLAFSRHGESDIEREAIYLGALLQVPVSDLQDALAPLVRKYRNGKWALISPVLNGEEEALAATAYRISAIEVVKTVFQANEPTAKIALDYWNALERPPRDWPDNTKEARKTSLR